MESAWRNFKNIFPRPLFIIIFRPEMLKFHPYSILTGDTKVEFVIYCVLNWCWNKRIVFWKNFQIHEFPIQNVSTLAKTVKTVKKFVERIEIFFFFTFQNKFVARAVKSIYVSTYVLLLVILTRNHDMHLLTYWVWNSDSG